MKKSETRKCIYCLQEKIYSTQKGEVNDFNKEHVVHKALSPGFRTRNPTLLGRVCVSCNTYFGNGIDRLLTRGTWEALLRLIYGLKPLSEANELTEERISYRISSPDPIYDGVDATLIVKDSELTYEFKPTFAFELKENQQWLHVTEQKLVGNKELPSMEALTGRIVLVSSNPEVDEPRMKDLLKTLGQQLSGDPQVTAGTVLVLGDYTVDKELFRAIVKIAFNYFAFVTEPISLAIASLSDFDQVRNFIRYGHQPDYTFVYEHNQHVNNPNAPAQWFWNREGHIVGVDEVTGKVRTIQAVVRLFNTFAWEIILAPDYRGLRYEFSSGHHWDIQDRVCKKIY